MLSSKERQILEALEARPEAAETEIVTVEVVGAKKAPTIRVYIDTEHGVAFDDLSAAQKWIDEVVEAIDPFPGAYMLEVSSPGIDRPLRTPEHFMRFVGETAALKTVSAIEGRTGFKGTITEADDSRVVLDCEGISVSIPYDSIKRANLKGTFDFNGKND